MNHPAWNPAQVACQTELSADTVKIAFGDSQFGLSNLIIAASIDRARVRPLPSAPTKRNGFISISNFILTSKSLLGRCFIDE
jgi:hypothetical protein